MNSADISFIEINRKLKKLQKHRIRKVLKGAKKTILEQKWQNFKEIFNKKNISRKECLLLPMRTVLKALKLQ